MFQEILAFWPVTGSIWHWPTPESLPRGPRTNTFSGWLQTTKEHYLFRSTSATGLGRHQTELGWIPLCGSAPTQQLIQCSFGQSTLPPSLKVKLTHKYAFLINLFIFRERGREGEREERNINVWLPLTHPLLGTWPETQACSLTGNRTGDLLVHRPALNPLSYTSQGSILIL